MMLLTSKILDSGAPCGNDALKADYCFMLTRCRLVESDVNRSHNDHTKCEET